MAQTLTNLNINDNNAVISALREGDEEVFDHIYRYYFRGLCAFCSQYVTLSESEEIVQDTMMWLWENRKTLIPELTLKTLLFTIVKNKALNKISHFEIKRKAHQEIAEKYETEFSLPGKRTIQIVRRGFKKTTGRISPGIRNESKSSNDS